MQLLLRQLAAFRVLTNAVKRHSKARSALAASAGILAGFLVYYSFSSRVVCGPSDEPGEDGLCHIHWVDALYLTVVTISTVGYGDAWSYPNNSEMRACRRAERAPGRLGDFRVRSSVEANPSLEMAPPSAAAAGLRSSPQAGLIAEESGPFKPQVFSVFYILIGVTFVFAQLARLLPR